MSVSLIIHAAKPGQFSAEDLAIFFENDRRKPAYASVRRILDELPYYIFSEWEGDIWSSQPGRYLTLEEAVYFLIGHHKLTPISQDFMNKLTFIYQSRGYPGIDASFECFLKENAGGNLFNIIW